MTATKPMRGKNEVVLHLAAVRGVLAVDGGEDYSIKNKGVQVLADDLAEALARIEELEERLNRMSANIDRITGGEDA